MCPRGGIGRHNGLKTWNNKIDVSPEKSLKVHNSSVSWYYNHKCIIMLMTSYDAQRQKKNTK